MKLEPGAPEYRTGSFGQTSRVRVTRAGDAFQEAIKAKRGRHRVMKRPAGTSLATSKPFRF